MIVFNSNSLYDNARKPVNRFRTSQELKILSWNIYMLPWISLFNRNARRASAIAERLRGADAHIIVFQEAFSSSCRNILSKGLSESHPFQYAPLVDKQFSLRANSGLWVVSKFPLHELDSIRFDVGKGYDSIARKGAMLLEGTFDSKRFQLLVTHLQADDFDELRRIQCSDIRKRLLNPFFDETVPQLLCGDFNIDQNETEQYQRMLDLLDARNGVLSGPLQVTYDQIENKLAYKPNGKQRILDYALVRNDAILKRIDRTIRSFSHSFGDSEKHLSDHYGIEVSIQF